MHGWGDPDNAWIDWLARELKGRRFDVAVPKLPRPMLPDLPKWGEVLREAVGALDRNTVVVAHSMGVPAVLRLLNDYPGEVKIAGIVTVAGFGDGIFEKLGTPFAQELDFERISARAKTKVCIYSDNDPLVSPKRSERLAWWLGAREVVVVGGGHFFGSKLVPNAINKLPAALEAVLSCYPRGFWRRAADGWQWLRRLAGLVPKRKIGT